jgi:hypothetical protein
MGTKWSMQGTLLGACSCDWGCPCSFDARPTRGFCEGGYVWHIEKGNFGGVPLDGLTWAWVGHSPGPLHEGNVTFIVLVDEKATAEQRQALANIGEGRSGGPWTIFMSVAGKRPSTQFLPFEVHLDGLNSKVRVGDALSLELGPILNPVTGEPEEIYVEKPTGFTSKRLTMGATRALRLHSEINYDHTGKYGEFSKFEYSGESPE